MLLIHPCPLVLHAEGSAPVMQVAMEERMRLCPSAHPGAAGMRQSHPPVKTAVAVDRPLDIHLVVTWQGPGWMIPLL